MIEEAATYGMHANRKNSGSLMRFSRNRYGLSGLSFACIAVLLVQTWVSPARADVIDDAVAREMKAHGIPGVSLSVVKDGKIVRSQAYGKVDKESGTPVTTKTLFQAGSISKPVSALGALVLVEKGKLSLDTNVNEMLKSWKVPDNEFTAEQKVTLSRILSHSAGLTIHGFGGYAAGTEIPTLVQILNGEKPANTMPIRVIFTPGSKWQYSGGGYVVLQQMIIDVIGKTFPDFMKESVLTPLEMGRSTFEQPISDALAKTATSGHSPDGNKVPGGWNIYPEMTAAGLWTTPEDLCRFILAIQKAWQGQKGGIISPAMAKDMLTVKSGEYGLGLCIKNGGKFFQHGGRDEGFDAFLYASSNVGVVVMINANNNNGAIGRMMNAAWSQYGEISGFDVPASGGR